MMYPVVQRRRHTRPRCGRNAGRLSGNHVRCVCSRGGYSPRVLRRDARRGIRRVRARGAAGRRVRVWPSVLPENLAGTTSRGSRDRTVCLRRRPRWKDRTRVRLSLRWRIPRMRASQGQREPCRRTPTGWASRLRCRRAAAAARHVPHWIGLGHISHRRGAVAWNLDRQVCRRPSAYGARGIVGDNGTILAGTCSGAPLAGARAAGWTGAVRGPRRDRPCRVRIHAARRMAGAAPGGQGQGF